MNRKWNWFCARTRCKLLKELLKFAAVRVFLLQKSPNLENLWFNKFAFLKFSDT